MMKALRIIHNQRGDAIVLALIVTAMSLISSFVIMNYTRQVQASSKNPRVKSMMTSLEAKVRAELLRPSSYTGCNAATGKATCQLIQSRITSFSRPIPGAKCAALTPNCGILVSVVNFSVTPAAGGPSLARAQVQIAYQGQELALRPIDIVMDIPADILQTVDNRGIYKCPESAPKFNGFLPDGRMDCVAFVDRAPPGSFAGSINPATLAVTQVSLPSSANCPANSPSAHAQFIDGVNWGSGGTAFSVHCAYRLDPFLTFGFTPQVGVGGGRLVVVPNTD